MELRARIRHFSRPAAFTVALTALLVPAIAGPATADAAKRKKRYPVVTSVRPMDAKVGDTIVIRGRNFKRGKNKNTVVFKRDGARAVFQKATLATARQIRVVVPDTLRAFLPDNTTARFRLRVLSQRFSKKFTALSKSPSITALPKPVAPATSGSTAPATGGTTPAPVQPPPAPPRVCHGDEDGDLLDAGLENNLGLDACKADSDGDGVPDGYEYQSARDLNDDEYQETNTSLPYPGKRPYPNPLFKDSNVDYDGDGLPLDAEYRLWKKYGAPPAGLLPSSTYRLLYSDGEQYSLSTREGGVGRRHPSQLASNYLKFEQFLDWARDPDHGYDPVVVPVAEPWYDPANQVELSILDVNQNGSVDSGDRAGYPHDEEYIYDRDGDHYLSDDERDEDADGLTNIDELRAAMQPAYWEACYENAKEKPYPVTYAGTDLTVRDTDDDGIIDGVDDQDHDDVPNIMELSRNMASGHADWDAHDGQCVVSDAIPATGPDGPDEDTDPDPLEDWHPNDYGRVNPFNPCLPHDWSRTCPSGVEFDAPFAPFDQSTNWFALQ